MKAYETYTTQMTVMPKGDALYSERATTITVDDEAGGCFLVLKQEGKINPPGHNQIAIDSQEWEHIKAAVEAMFKECNRIDENNEEPQA